MPAKSKAREPSRKKSKSATSVEEKIRPRAYELYEQRGRIDGHALDDWLQAEAGILGRRGQPRKGKRKKE